VARGIEEASHWAHQHGVEFQGSLRVQQMARFEVDIIMESRGAGGDR
jgi:hypothetical protein